MAQFILYTITISFAVGIFLRSFYEVSYEVLVGLLLISGLGAFWWARWRSRRALGLSLFIFVLVLGVLRFDISTWDTASATLDRFEEEISITGVVSREPEKRESTTHVYIKTTEVNNVDIDSTILLYADRNTSIKYGDRLEVTGNLQKPEAFETDLGRTFNYPGYLEARDVSHVVFFPEVTVMESGQGNWLISTLLTGKRHFIRSVELLIPEPQVGLGEGLLLGVRSALGDELEQVFRRTGIIHIVVLSGYNVMLVVIFVMTILSYLFGMRTRLIFGVVAIISFALLVGLSATVVRASLMAVLILVARATGRSYAVLRALFFVGFLMLIFNPYLLVFDTGFQLSFVATLGLILLAPHLERIFQLVPSVIGVREFLVATVATQIFVMPLLLYQIGEFSVVSVLVNVLVLPMVPVAMLLTFLSGMIGLVSTTLAMPLAYLTHLSLTYILSVATWFSSLPFASYVVPPFPFWIMVLAYVVMGYVIWKLLPKGEETEEDTTLQLEGWTIEEEKETAGSPEGEPATDVPIFFR